MRVFNETQRFDQWWMKLIYFGMIAMLLYFLYMWYIVNKAVDKVGPYDTTGQLIAIATILATLILLYVCKLKTEINEIGIHYKFQPFNFSKQTIRWADMDKCYMRTYSPFREFGGWGFRKSFEKKGIAYNVKGNKGIQIELKTGKRLLIGCQKQNEAQRIITRYFKRQL